VVVAVAFEMYGLVTTRILRSALEYRSSLAALLLPVFAVFGTNDLNRAWPPRSIEQRFWSWRSLSC